MDHDTVHKLMHNELSGKTFSNYVIVPTALSIANVAIC